MKLRALKIFAVAAMLLIVSSAVAGERKTIAFLEEHSVAPGTYQEFGARYTVPVNRKAVVTAFFCEVSSVPGQNNVQVSVFVQPRETVVGPRTPWAGTNPLSCSNAPNKPTALTQAGPIVMLPGDLMQTFFTNMSKSDAFVMLGAWIVEEDL
jgi:hypothetical protein